MKEKRAFNASQLETTLAALTLSLCQIHISTLTCRTGRPLRDDVRAGAILHVVDDGRQTHLRGADSLYRRVSE